MYVAALKERINSGEFQGISLDELRDVDTPAARELSQIITMRANAMVLSVRDVEDLEDWISLQCTMYLHDALTRAQEKIVKAAKTAGPEWRVGDELSTRLSDDQRQILMSKLNPYWSIEYMVHGNHRDDIQAGDWYAPIRVGLLFGKLGVDYVMPDMAKMIEAGVKRSSHVSKFGNSYNDNAGLNTVAMVATEGVTSADARHGQVSYPEGCASLRGMQRVMCAPVNMFGKMTCLIQMLEDDCPMLREALVSLVGDVEVIDDWFVLAGQARANLPEPRVPSEQLILQSYLNNPASPEDHLVSPIPSSRLFASIKAVSQDVSRRHPWHYVPMNWVRVGGANPQNLGGVIEQFGGLLPQLKASLPKVKPPATLVERVEKGRPLLRLWNERLDSLVSVNGNRFSLRRYDRCCREYVLEAMAQVIEYRTLYRQSPGQLKRPSNPIEGSLVADELDHETKKALASALTKLIARRLAPRQESDIGKRQISVIDDVLYGFLDQLANGAFGV